MTKSIIVYRTGSLGDTLVAVPSLRAVRRRFPEARLTLLCDRQAGTRLVLASEVLHGAGLVDDFLVYTYYRSAVGRLVQFVPRARAWLEIRRRGYDAVVYLATSKRAPAAVARDRKFFRAAGVRALYGFEGFEPPPVRGPHGFAPVPHEADHLLARLRQDGFTVPAPGTADPTIRLEEADDREVDRFVRSQPPDGGRRWLSVGHGGKKPLSVWPIERYRKTVAEILGRHDLWPVVFGGPEDLDSARDLIASWGRGWATPGLLSIRGVMAAMRRCAMHLGNDTGTMHMAVAAGIPCVGIYASQDLPGRWHPYGPGHTVLRTTIECENCRLVACVDRRMACIRAIDVPTAVEACDRMLATIGAAGRHPRHPV